MAIDVAASLALKPMAVHEVSPRSRPPTSEGRISFADSANGLSHLADYLSARMEQHGKNPSVRLRGLLDRQGGVSKVAQRGSEMNYSGEQILESRWTRAFAVSFERASAAGISSCVRATALVILLFLPLVGCTTIHVHGPDLQVTTAHWFGFPNVRFVSNSKDMTVVNTNGLGFVTTPRGFTLGWLNEAMASVPDRSRCHVVLWLENPDQLKSILALLKDDKQDLSNICVVGNREERS